MVTEFIIASEMHIIDDRATVGVVPVGMLFCAHEKDFLSSLYYNKDCVPGFKTYRYTEHNYALSLLNQNPNKTRQCTCKIILRFVSVTIVAVENQ